MTLPVVIDLRVVLRRLAREEEDERRELGRLEARLRRYEDEERPAYEQWLRLELGPAVSRLDELAAELRARQMLAARVTELVEDHDLHPREALSVVLHGVPAGFGTAEGADRDEVEARRRAKRDRKRAARKEQLRAAKAARGASATEGDAAGEPARRRLVGLYRDLARSLHPDSPRVLRALPPARLRAIWAEVQAAYATRSLERLLALATWVEMAAETGMDATTDATTDDGNAPAGNPAAAPVLSLAERHERLRALRRASRALDRRLAGLVAEPAWDFASAAPVLRRKMKQAATRRLASESEEMTAALRAVDEFLAAIGPPRPPGRRDAGRARRRR